VSNHSVLVHEVSKKYKQKQVLKHVNIQIKSGETMVFLGENGAGKSTLFKAIATLEPYEGQIEFGDEKNTALASKRRLGYVPEIPEVFDFLTVDEHLEFIAKLFSLSGYQAYKKRLMSEFDLLKEKKTFGKNLSKGMKQKLNICVALLTCPDIILFDEPFVGLDIAAVETLKSTITRFREEGKTVLISTHQIETVIGLYDKIAIIKDGKIASVFDGEGYQTLASTQQLVKSFFGKDTL